MTENMTVKMPTTMATLGQKEKVASSNDHVLASDGCKATRTGAEINNRKSRTSKQGRKTCCLVGRVLASSFFLCGIVALMAVIILLS